ncbi:MAG: DUF3656 domain-containing protein, partial [Smithella sp.]
ELAGFRVDRVEKEKIYPNNMKNLKAGITLYRNHDMAFTGMLKKSSGNRRIAVKMDFRQEDEKICLTVQDEDGNRAETVRDITFEPSRNPLQVIKQIYKQLTSTGNTPYLVTVLTIQPDNPGFLPASALNGIRREVLEKLTEIRMEVYRHQKIPFVPNNVPYPIKRLDFHANVLNDHARRFYERHGAVVDEPAFETLSDPTGKNVMTCRYCIRHQLDMCPKITRSGNPIREPLRIRDAHHTYRLEFDCNECRMFLILEGK